MVERSFDWFAYRDINDVSVSISTKEKPPPDVFALMIQSKACDPPQILLMRVRERHPPPEARSFLGCHLSSAVYIFAECTGDIVNHCLHFFIGKLFGISRL
jgi:hypothetical protein